MTTETKHTPEPWKLETLASSLRITKAEFADINDDIFVLGDCHDAQRYANARRIVACVNRLKGFSTDDIESGKVKVSL